MGIQPKNLTAQLKFRARGNPPGAHPDSAVGNFFPGLEFNFLSVWKRIFIGIELNESSGDVMAVDPDAAPDIRALLGWKLVGVDVVEQDGRFISQTPVVTDVVGPNGKKTEHTLEILGQTYLEWGNALADLHYKKGGSPNTVPCRFQSEDLSQFTVVALKVRRLFEKDTVLISRDAVPPGELTQSLCSPWQTDFIGCACYYWAANRPDYINTWQKADGTHGGGHNWLDKTRNTQPPSNAGGAQKPSYSLEPTKTLKHEDIMGKGTWEKLLRFVIGGKDEE